MNKFERAEALRRGEQVFRIRHVLTGAWWEGIAGDAEEALSLAIKSNALFSPDNIEIRQYTEHGGWRLCGLRRKQ